MSAWSLHCCLLDRECRKVMPDGPVWRIYGGTPRWTYGIALRPADRFARLEGASWVYRDRRPTMTSAGESE